MNTDNDAAQERAGNTGDAKVVATSHPGWATLNLLIIVGGVALILWMNCTTFDATEFKAIAEIGVIVAVREFLRMRSGK